MHQRRREDWRIPLTLDSDWAAEDILCKVYLVPYLVRGGAGQPVEFALRRGYDDMVRMSEAEFEQFAGRVQELRRLNRHSRQWLTTTQAAAALGSTRYRVRRMCETGQITALRRRGLYVLGSVAMFDSGIAAGRPIWR